MKVVEGGIEAQTEQVLKNLTRAESGGSDVEGAEDTVFLSNWRIFEDECGVRARFWGLRAGTLHGRLLACLDVMVDIECIAALS